MYFDLSISTFKNFNLAEIPSKDKMSKPQSKNSKKVFMPKLIFSLLVSSNSSFFMFMALSNKSINLSSSYCLIKIISSIFSFSENAILALASLIFLA